MLNLAVGGAAGRMGRRIIALAAEEGSPFEIVAAIESSDHPDIGRDAGVIAGTGALGVSVADSMAGEPEPDVMIDFSVPLATERWVGLCSERAIPLVIGTTGLTDRQIQLIEEAARKIPVLLGANMSVGVNLLFELVGQVARQLGSDYDIEIVESHHRFKRDAPSGTALELARRIAASVDRPFPDCLEHGRQGREAIRETSAIGMHAVRAGDIVGEHRVLFSTLGETVELRHVAHTRDTFVRGALRAAEWLCGRDCGMYTMADVLGL